MIHCESKFCTMEWQFYTDIVEGVYFPAGKKLSTKRKLRKNSQEDFFASRSREMTTCHGWQLVTLDDDTWQGCNNHRDCCF